MAKFNRGDVVVITGASSGIGRVAAAVFARAGARLALLARDEARLDSLVEECAALGADARAWTVDVTDAARVAEVAREVRERFGRLDVWINNAGVGAVGRFDEVPLDVHRRVIDVNLGGYLNCAHAVLPLFRDAGRGTLINNASICAYVAQPASVAYVTSKFAVRGLTYALRQEVALMEGDIDVCVVHPQVVATKVFEHMANFTGERVRINLPAVSATDVAHVFLNVARRPRREAYAGVFGHVSVLGHRFFPAVAERLMIWLGRWYFARPRAPKLDPNAGNLFDPAR